RIVECARRVRRRLPDNAALNLLHACLMLLKRAIARHYPSPCAWLSRHRDHCGAGGLMLAGHVLKMTRDSTSPARRAARLTIDAKGFASLARYIESPNCDERPNDTPITLA